MVYTGVNNTVFIFTNLNPPPDEFFQGYCFVENNFIFGADGAKRYQYETGKTIPASQDDCYVVAQRRFADYKFDIDFAGYTILYYFHDGETWAVSNSFAQVVDFLRSRGVKILPNYAHLHAANGRSMALGQLSSLETLAHGIRVAPRTHSLIITPSAAVLLRRKDPNLDPQEYSVALSAYLETWISRFETLMYSPETDFTVDVTGGVDSRTNLALVQAARRRLGSSYSTPRLRCGGGPGNRTDLEVATRIAKHFNLTVNDNRFIDRLPLYGSEGFQVYRDLSMGTYFPFYRPTQGPTQANITIGGGGGGIHRKTYELIIKSNDPNVFFAHYARGFKDTNERESFIRDSERFLNTALQDGEDPLRVLLREGRVRYHSGRTPRTEVAFTPLHSLTASQSQKIAGETRIDDGQFNYDIMHSTEPDLVTMAYDESSKFPSDRILYEVDIRKNRF